MTPPQQHRDADIQQAIDHYLRARQAILKLGREVPGRIGGNDNIIGRIGEFIGLRFLEALGQEPIMMEGSSNPGFDLEEGNLRTQVKAITHENKRGRSVRLTPGWTQFVLMELGEHYTPERIGLLTSTQQEIALADNFAKTAMPVVSLMMLGSKGLIGVYGRVYTRDELKQLGI